MLAAGLSAAGLGLRQRQADDGFDIVRWELTTVANKWLFALGAPLRSDPPEEEALARYFAADDRDRGEAARVENVVEAAIEGRIDAVLRAQGVRGRLALPGPLAVWPPVDVELTHSPRVLVTSPRERIERSGARLLRPDLDTAEAIELESEREGEDRSLAALVVSTGGLATYPATVSSRRSYAGTLETAAHEWVHHYLAFYPLGYGIPAGDRLVINETVADLAGDEVALLALERFGDPTSAPAGAAATPAVDEDRVLRELRLEVEGLLAEGLVGQAERRMEAVRLELAAAGVRIRRINQAYFAWYGTYAARADSVDPLGSQLRELRERAGSLARFLALVRDVTSREDVARLLDEPGVAG